MRERVCFTLMIVFTAALLAPFIVNAHEISNGYLTLSGKSTETLSGRLSLMPYDLELEVKLDDNFDGNLTWKEVKNSEHDLTIYYSSILQIRQSGKPCRLNFQEAAMESIGGANLIALPFISTCPNKSNIDITYNGIFDQDDSHKVLVTLNFDGRPQSNVLTSDNRTVVISDAAPNSWTTVTTFVYQGIIHIWIGIDHILFLLATLLTVNLCRRDDKWQGESSKKQVITSTLYLVTAFTLAHSITLTTTALNWYQPSSRWVEFGIAVSVMLTAINNIWPVIHRLVIITFAFGLLHGMGFASVFGELQSNASSPLLSIASFNIGVEIGQLVVVLLLLPVLLMLRHVRLYATAVMPLASALIAAIALNWAIQRF